MLSINLTNIQADSELSKNIFAEVKKCTTAVWGNFCFYKQKLRLKTFTPNKI